MNEELMAIEKNNIMTQIGKVVPNQNYGRMLVINSDFIIINSYFITLKLFYHYIALMVNLQAS